MATKFFLQDAASDVNPNTPDLNKLLSLTAGASLTASVTNTVAGPVTPRTTSTEITVTAGGTRIYSWLSNPLNAVTISNTPTINYWAKESNSLANATITARIVRCDSVGGFISEICAYAVVAELGTTIAVKNFTEAVTNTTLSAGNRIGVLIDIDDGSAVTMGSGKTVTFDYNGGTAAADGDTWVSFVETITEQAGGGTTTPQTLTATAITISASLVRQTNKNLTATTIALTASMQRQVNKVVTATVAQSASITKAVLKPLSATVTTTASIVALRVFVRALTATVTLSASMQRQVAKALSAIATVSAAMVRKTLKNVTATVTTSATLSALKVVLKALTATVTASATMARQTAKKLTATTVALSATIAKQVNKAMTATTVTATAALTAQKVILRVLTATVTVTASMVRRISKPLSVTVSVTATVSKQLAVRLTATVTTTASMVTQLVTTVLFSWFEGGGSSVGGDAARASTSLEGDPGSGGQ